MPRLLWPASLFGRLTLCWVATLLLGHLLNATFTLSEVFHRERAREGAAMSKEVATAVAILERVSPAERESWLAKLDTDRSRYSLVETAAAQRESRVASTPPSTSEQRWSETLEAALGPGRLLPALRQTPDGEVHFAIRLDDGPPLFVGLKPFRLVVYSWQGTIFLLQMLALLGFTWAAVRETTKPLQRLASEAEKLGSQLACAPIPEHGPVEVARAAAAFNAMQRRIAHHLGERIRILAAISHDLQTPITRMRLRADLMGDGPWREKLTADLDAMQSLVTEGIAYARSAHAAQEASCRVDVDALVQSLIGDFTDAGRAVRVEGELGTPMVTRPNALRRIVNNLVENALKFGEDVEVCVARDAGKGASVAVLDRGPGIPAEELLRVLEPFQRVEGSRSRETGGTGLGLAIANQLATGIGGVLTLENREGG
ncbi:MAG TPA: ATP-binding protein, partial [Polyangiaceae bacterium]